MSVSSSSSEARRDDKMPDRMGTTSWPAPPPESVLAGPTRASASTVEAIKLAIDEVNEQGGVLGSRIEPTFVDGSPDESGFTDPINRLILENHVCALFGCCSPSGRQNVLPVVEKYNHLLLYPAQCEGREQSPNVVYTGAAASQQILPAIQFATDTLRKRRLFLILL